MPYLVGASSVAVVDRSLQAREATRKLLQFHLKRAKNRMKQFADKRRSERSFQLGDLVYLRLQPYSSRRSGRFLIKNYLLSTMARSL